MGAQWDHLLQAAPHEPARPQVSDGSPLLLPSRLLLVPGVADPGPPQGPAPDSYSIFRLVPRFAGTPSVRMSNGRSSLQAAPVVVMTRRDQCSSLSGLWSTLVSAV